MKNDRGGCVKNIKKTPHKTSFVHSRNNLNHCIKIQNCFTTSENIDTHEACISPKNNPDTM